jgi:UDP-N-acetylmuramoyl-tripeptide--D-alanyl-D-alanine ligase
MSATRSAIWAFPDLLAATGGVVDGVAPAAVHGVSIDTRTIEPGDLFVALKDVRDGHEFVTTAFKAGASAALVATGYARKSGDGCLIRVDDPLAALERLGRAARARLGRDARVIAVTGSAGKTTTKEMLRACFSAIGPTHASEKSYNNHWGVPLTLARMPADTAFGVFEIGMNHAGEITPLTRLVRPHAAVITTIAPAHLGNFNSIEEIADAKAEIFAGLSSDGFAVLPADSPFYPQLAASARDAGVVNVRSFGEAPVADLVRVIVDDTSLRPDRSSFVVVLSGSDRLEIDLAIPGRHNAVNSAAAIGAVLVATQSTDLATVRSTISETLAKMVLPTAGRGQVVECGGITVIDESYNANPASMRAALETMALRPRDRRRIAVLGDMRELGSGADRLHAELADAVESSGVDLLFAAGPHMRHLYQCVPEAKRVIWADTSAGIEAKLLEITRPGDVVMIKGSNGSKMAPLVASLLRRHSSEPAGP